MTSRRHAQDAGLWRAWNGTISPPDSCPRSVAIVGTMTFRWVTPSWSSLGDLLLTLFAVPALLLGERAKVSAPVARRFPKRLAAHGDRCQGMVARLPLPNNKMQLTSGGLLARSRAFIESPLAADLGVMRLLAAGLRHSVAARSAASRLIGLIIPGTLADGCDSIISIVEPPPRGPELVVLVVDPGVHGWACVDFGVEGAAELPREGEAFLVQVPSMGILRTSTRPSELLSFFPRDIFVEAHGERSSLPPGVGLRRSTSDTRTPTARSLDIACSSELKKLQRPLAILPSFSDHGVAARRPCP